MFYVTTLVCRLGLIPCGIANRRKWASYNRLIPFSLRFTHSLSLYISLIYVLLSLSQSFRLIPFSLPNVRTYAPSFCIGGHWRGVGEAIARQFILHSGCVFKCWLWNICWIRHCVIVGIVWNEHQTSQFRFSMIFMFVGSVSFILIANYSFLPSHLHTMLGQHLNGMHR